MQNKTFISTDYIISQYMHPKEINISKANHNQDLPDITPNTYHKFIKINGIIYCVSDSYSLIRNLINRSPLTQIQYIEPRTELIVLNKTNLDYILGYLTNKKLCKKVKRQFMYNLKRLSPMLEINDYPSSKCIFDSSGSYVKFENDRFVLNQISDEDILNRICSDLKYPKNTLSTGIVNGYLFNHLNDLFIVEEYQISNTTKNILRKITGNNPDSLKALAMLTAAAYSNDLPLNKAVIIIADDSSYECVEYFFELFFDNNIYTLNRDSLKNANAFFTAYTNTLFMSGGSYLLKEDSYVNFNTVKNLVKPNFFEAKCPKNGSIRFKNKIPLIILTKNKDYADKFGCKVNSYTIKADKEFHSIDSAFIQDLKPLRQSLALYGLKLLSSKSQKKTKLPKNNATSIKAATKEFADLYCTPNANKHISKTELRDAFNKYLSAYYPALKCPPIAICNHFTELGFKTMKKRLDRQTNPVWVILGIEFNFEKFNNDIVPLINNNTAENVNDPFEEAFSELLSSKFKLWVKNFNV